MTRRLLRRGFRARAVATARAVAIGVAPILLAACTSMLARAPAPETALDASRPYGIEAPLLQIWGDSLDPQTVDQIVALRARALDAAHRAQIAEGDTVRMATLALSGGGADGAFGAGLLAGWTARGDRPRFKMVTGISTGAIISVFAYLGPEHDETLRRIYTEYASEDLFVPAILRGLTGGTALLDTRRYRRLIERYITGAVVRAMADAYRDGRVLLIGTTNLDAARPVIWNIGAIAASGHPDARRLIHDVIQASSAIPAAFPPVLIPVAGPGGRGYDEMHVDGGATQQVMLFSPQIRSKRIDAAVGAAVDRSVYVVLNKKLQRAYEPVRPRLAAIAGKAVTSLIGGSGSGDIYRIFAVARRDGLDLNVTSIPRDFVEKPEAMFDTDYMRALYDVGYEAGLSGEAWSPHPPGYAPASEDAPDPGASRPPG